MNTCVRSREEPASAELAPEMKKKRNSAPNVAILTPLAMRPETGAGAPWYASGIQRWKHDAAGPGLSLLDANGKGRASLAMTDTGPLLVLVDEAGKGRASLGVTADGLLLFLKDEAGKVRASLGVTADGPVLELYDAKGRLLKSLP